MVTNERQTFRREHIEDTLSGFNRHFLVDIKGNMPVGALQGDDRVIGRIGNQHQRLSTRLHSERQMTWRMAISTHRMNARDNLLAIIDESRFFGEWLHVLFHHLRNGFSRRLKTPRICPEVKFLLTGNVTRIRESRLTIFHQAANVIGVKMAEYNE